mmetsp:Transcript_22274/g.52953  ORF Transcript_22274/g.52953 Transcript_22274/m.52953 type:complete len:602 (+) Transcript_22274:272-2077(+)
MPRRQQYKKKNKRHRKGRYGGDSRDDGSNARMQTSLEEDLRQQRIRQQERDERREKEEEKKKMEHEDCNHDLGFHPPLTFENYCDVANVAAKTKHLVLKGTVPQSPEMQMQGSYRKEVKSLPSMPSSVIRLSPSFLLRHVEETSPTVSTSQRNTLRKLWLTQHHLETLTVVPRAASLYCKSKWPQHYDSNMRCSWDLSCKQRLHPSARTLDVAMLGSEPTPTIATIFQDGWGLLRQQSQHKIHTIKSPSAYAIRMNERSAMCGMIVRQGSANGHTTPYSFRWYPLPHATSYVEAQLPRPVTDFCFGKDIALFACPRYSTLSSESLNPLFLPMVEAGTDASNFTYYDSAVRSINVRNFPQSDALRVEMMCEKEEKLVAFGHRNGQVSVLDLRASGTVCSILQYEPAAGSGEGGLGSVSDLGFLPSGAGIRVLVKRSFGSCQLHDLRKASSSTSRSGSSGNIISDRDHTSTTALHSMRVHPDEIDPMLSAHCNGFAIDPGSHHTMVSPYISAGTGDARLGIWSLQTGHMVGSRLLLSNAGRRESSALHVELCSKTTPSFRPGDDGHDHPSFGVWMKCGAITSGKLRSRVGSLHQICVPGRWTA